MARPIRRPVFALLGDCGCFAGETPRRDESGDGYRHENRAGTGEIERCRKNFKNRVDTGKPVPLYSAHRDGDAAGAALSPASPKRRAFVADQIGARLCLLKRPLFEN